MAGRSIKTTVELDGEAKYKQSLNSINQALRVSSSEMGAVTSAYDKNNASVDDLTKKGDVLAKQIEQQTQKQQILNAAITDAKAAYEAAVKKAAEMAAEYGENSKQAQDAAKAVTDAEKAVNGYEIQANNATKTLNNMKRQQDENNKAIDELNNKNTNGLASKFEKLSENAKKFGSVAAAAAKAAAGAIAAVGTAAAGAVKGVVDMANQTAQLGDKIDKSSQKLGVSAEFYQEWDAVLQHSGTSMDAMSATFKKLATASQGATDKQRAAFEQLGLSMEQVQNMSAEELFTAVVGQLQQMEDSTERTALATTLLGKGAQELGPLLNTSAEDTQKMIDEVNRLGGVMSNEAVKASATYQDTLQDLQTAVSGIKNTLAAEVMPIITMVMAGLTALITGDNGGLNMISEGINSFVDMLSGALPNILTMVTTLFTDLLATATDNLPSLIETVTGALLNIIETIMKMLPDILNAGVEILLTLAEGIANSIPELIPVIVDVILTVVDNLIANIPMLIDAALAIIVGLADGLIGALPQLVERIPEIITAIINALLSSIPLLIDAAVQLFVAMTEALPVALPAIVGMIPQIIDAIINAFMETDWIDLGVSIITSIGEGLKAGVANIGGMIKDAASGISAKVKGFFGGGDTVEDDTTTYGGAGAGGTRGGNITYVQNNYSPKALSRNEINQDTQRQLQLAGMK